MLLDLKNSNLGLSLLLQPGFKNFKMVKARHATSFVRLEGWIQFVVVL